MSVKGTSDTLFVGKTESSIITATTKRKAINYESLKEIDYMYASGTEIGYLNFVDNSNQITRFEFAKNANGQIVKTVEFLKNNISGLETHEHNVNDLKFYQKNLFTIIISFILGFPLGAIGLFLMWHYKKSHHAARVLVTFMAFLFWGTSGYLSYMNYKSAVNRANVVIENYNNILSNEYSGAIKSDKSEVLVGTNEESSESEGNGLLSVGDVYESDNFKIMYINSGDYSVDNEFMQPESGNKYIFAEFSIENIGSTDYSTGSALFDCYADDTECKQPIVSSEGALTSITSLSPGKNTKGKIFFEVPANASVIELEYKINVLTSKKVLFTFK